MEWDEDMRWDEMPLHYYTNENECVSDYLHPSIASSHPVLEKWNEESKNSCKIPWSLSSSFDHATFVGRDRAFDGRSVMIITSTSSRQREELHFLAAAAWSRSRPSRDWGNTAYYYFFLGLEARGLTSLGSMMRNTRENSFRLLKGKTTGEAEFR